MDETRTPEERKARLLLPPLEVDLLTFAEAKAKQLAAERRVTAGHIALRRGVARAEREHASGASYGSHLVSEWRRSMDAYAEEYGHVLIG